MDAPRDWVDLFSNEAFVDNQRTESLPALLKGECFPVELYFSMSHEATHHWCFRSLVGSALFTVKLQALSAAFEFGKSRGNDHNAEWDCYSFSSKFRAVKRMLDPISEGMAHFTEFDIYPSDYDQLPQYQNYLLHVFSGFTKEEWLQRPYSETEHRFKAMLFLLRLNSDEALHRKSALFISPLDVTRSPYLAGYLFVKNIQMQLALTHAEFNDPVFFLQYLKDYFFEDAELTAMIMDGSIKDEIIVPHFARYIDKRISNLLNISTQSIKIYQSERASQMNEEKSKGIMTTGLDHTLATLQRTVHSLKEDMPNLEYLFYMRKFFKLTCLRCYVEVDDLRIKIYTILNTTNVPVVKRMDLLESRKALDLDHEFAVLTCLFKNSSTIMNYVGEATYEKYMSFEDEEQGFDTIIFLDQTIILPHSVGLNENDLKTINTYFTVVKPNFILSNIDEVLATVWKNSVGPSDVEKFHEKNFRLFAEQYEGRALNCANISLESLRDAMKERGFRKLVGEAVADVEILVYLSLLTTAVIHGKYPLIDEIIDKIQLRFGEKRVAALTECLANAGLPVIKKVKGLSMTMGL